MEKAHLFEMRGGLVLKGTAIVYMTFQHNSVVQHDSLSLLEMFLSQYDGGEGLLLKKIVRKIVKECKFPEVASDSSPVGGAHLRL